MFGLQVVVLGLGIVFLVLILLIGCTLLLERLSRKKATPYVPQLQAPEGIEEDNNQIIAIITAAIYAVLSQESIENNLSFRVRSIKRK